MPNNSEVYTDCSDRIFRPKAFILLPRRCVVERTFAWLGNYRRLCKDYEESREGSEGLIHMASIHTLLKRLTA